MNQLVGANVAQLDTASRPPCKVSNWPINGLLTLLATGGEGDSAHGSKIPWFLKFRGIWGIGTSWLFAICNYEAIETSVGKIGPPWAKWEPFCRRWVENLHNANLSKSTNIRNLSILRFRHNFSILRHFINFWARHFIFWILGLLPCNIKGVFS